MAEDPVSELVEARPQRTTHRPGQPVNIHPLPAGGGLSDSSLRPPPRLPADGHDEISALRLAVPIVRRWPLVLGCSAAVGALALAATFVIPPRYAATTSFTVEQGSNSLTIPKALGGLAGQLGGLLGAGMASGPSADYFTALATSRTIKEAVLSSRYADGKLTADGAGPPLLDLLDVRGGTPARRMENGARRLGTMVKPAVDRRGGVVSITVVDRVPDRAAAIGNRVMELLNKYNVEQRQSRSRQQRELAQRSLVEAQRELRAAEERLQAFLSGNRRYQQSPLLVFEANRLERTVLQKQEVVTGLAQAYEEARILEVGDIPVLSLVDAAVPPTRRSFPVRWQFLLGGLFAGGLVGLVLVYLLEARRTWIAEQQPDFLALRDAARAWRARLRGRPVRA
jgi:uncharacterized protein involved in exopolysaccharide biosynthesis